MGGRRNKEERLCGYKLFDPLPESDIQSSAKMPYHHRVNLVPLAIAPSTHRNGTK